MQHQPPNDPAESPAPGVIPDAPQVHDGPPTWRAGKKRDFGDDARAKARNSGRAGHAIHRPPPGAGRPKGR